MRLVTSHWQLCLLAMKPNHHSHPSPATPLADTQPCQSSTQNDRSTRLAWRLPRTKSTPLRAQNASPMPQVSGELLPGGQRSKDGSTESEMDRSKVSCHSSKRAKLPCWRGLGKAAQHSGPFLAFPTGQEAEGILGRPARGAAQSRVSSGSRVFQEVSRGQHHLL